MTSAYDYEELAYELYRESDDFIEALVSIRQSRNMSTKKLAEKMNVQEETILGLENGSLDPAWHLLVDYALEVGAFFHIQTNEAEDVMKASYSLTDHIYHRFRMPRWKSGRSNPNVIRTEVLAGDDETKQSYIVRSETTESSAYYLWNNDKKEAVSC